MVALYSPDTPIFAGLSFTPTVVEKQKANRMRQSPRIQSSVGLTLMAAIGFALVVACGTADEPETTIQVTPESQPTSGPTQNPAPTPATQARSSSGSVAIDLKELFDDVWLCTDGDGSQVQDLTTSGADDLTYSVEVKYTDTTVLVRSANIPSHDFESTLGCCAEELDKE
jgi:hypothetical protein